MKQSKLLVLASVSTLIFSLNSVGIACGPSTQMTKARVDKLLAWLSTVGDMHKLPPKTQIDAYFAPSFQKFTNGKLVASNADELLARRVHNQKQYRSASIQGPILDEIIDDNRAAIRYNVAFVDVNGKTTVENDTAFITFNKDGKVSEFREVFDNGNPVA